MTTPEFFLHALGEAGVDYFTGVPDSLLKSFCACVQDHVGVDRHISTANEGSAVALAMGYHLATGRVPLIYLQNSGLGNTVNPLMSLVDPEVYGIPLLLLIGWRGRPGVKDEPQHVKQGRVMLDTLEAMEIPYVVLEEDDERRTTRVIEEAVRQARDRRGAFALVVPKGYFAAYDPAPGRKEPYPLLREDAIRHIVESLDPDDIVVSTTGMASRELFEYRESTGEGHARDFLTVGGMGHASQIALGIAGQQPQRRVVCIDGDGAVLMHLGALAINGQYGGANFKHLLINNGAHDSVGGQPTVAFDIDLPRIATACGYRQSVRCTDHKELADALPGILAGYGPAFMEVRVKRGNRPDLGRPTTTPEQNKGAFMGFLHP